FGKTAVEMIDADPDLLPTPVDLEHCLETQFPGHFLALGNDAVFQLQMDDVSFGPGSLLHQVPIVGRGNELRSAQAILPDWWSHAMLPPSLRLRRRLYCQIRNNIR